MNNLSVTKEDGQVTMVMPASLAAIVKRAVRILGLDLILNDQFHESAQLSEEASTASIELAELHWALDRVVK